MVLFIALLVVLLVRLRRAALQDGPGRHLAGALWCAGLGLAVGGLFLHVWLDFATAVPFWSLAAVVLPVAGPARERRR